MSISTRKLAFHSLTIDRWGDFETLFGKNGACGGCWCMYWRVSSKEFQKNKGANLKQQMKKIIKSGTVPGLIAYDGSKPIGWISVAPREDFPRMENAPTLKRIDDKPVWSVACMFIHKDYRKLGVSTELIKAAVKYAKQNKAKIVEGYPHLPDKITADPFVYMGLLSPFEKAGFEEAARHRPKRPIMRKMIW